MNHTGIEVGDLVETTEVMTLTAAHVGFDHDSPEAADLPTGTRFEVIAITEIGRLIINHVKQHNPGIDTEELLIRCLQMSEKLQVEPTDPVLNLCRPGRLDDPQAGLNWIMSRSVRKVDRDAAAAEPVFAFCMVGAHTGPVTGSDPSVRQSLPEGWALARASYNHDTARWEADESAPARVPHCPQHPPFTGESGGQS